MIKERETSIFSLPAVLLNALNKAIRVPHANFLHIMQHVRKEWKMFFLLRGIAESEREWKAGACKPWVSMEDVVDG